MNIKIGAKIKELRKRGDITQERLAGALGVTNQAISRWESETGYPDIEYIKPLAEFFNVSIDYLFEHIEAEKAVKNADGLQVIMLTPGDEDENNTAEQIVTHLTNYKAVVLNLEKMGKEKSQQYLEFIKGAVYALKGNLDCVSINTYVLSPDNIRTKQNT